MTNTNVMANLPLNPSKLPRKLFKILLCAIIICFVFLAGFGLGTKNPTDGGYKAGYAAARAKLQAAGLFTSQVEMKSLIATVVAVGEGTIDIETPSTPANPLDEPLPPSRRILVGADTKLYRSDIKTQDEISDEMKSYSAKVKEYEAAVRAGEAATYPTTPSAEKLTEIALSDIKQGDRILVSAAQDISYEESFTATSVVVQQAVAATLPAPATVPPPTPAAVTP